MNYTIVTILILTMTFPGLFSLFSPLVYLTFAFCLLTKKTVRINPKLLIGFALFLTLGSLLVVIDVILNGETRFWTFWIGGFLTWFVFINLLKLADKPELLIHKSLVILGYVVAIVNLGYVAAFLVGVAKEPISLLPAFQAYFGISDTGFFAYSTSLLPHIGYIFPYFIVTLSSSDERVKTGDLPILIILLAIAGVLSLRLSVIAIILCSFTYYYFKNRKTRKKKISLIMSLFVLYCLVLFVYLYSSHPEILNGIFRLKLSDKVYGKDLRYEQIIFWWNSFWQSPLIGHGLSSATVKLYDIATGKLISYRPGIISPLYGSEFLYGKLLSDGGLIFLAYVLIFYYLVFVSKTDTSLPWQTTALRFSAVSMVFQSGTNSYLYTSGWLFTLMLPMVFISPTALHNRGMN